jgi:hypothetical protein
MTATPDNHDTDGLMQIADAEHEMSAEGAVLTSMRPSLHPDRREGIMMAHVTADSFELRTADLTRFTDRPPRLGPFTSRGRDLDVDGFLRRRDAPRHRLSCIPAHAA